MDKRVILSIILSYSDFIAKNQSFILLYAIARNTEMIILDA